MKRLAVVLLLLLSALPALAADTLSLTILHTNDLHGMVLPFAYANKNVSPTFRHGQMGGLARRATLIARMRRTARNPVVVVDAGDIFTRGPWHTRFYGIPEVEAMNAMGYDAACVGNNELKATEDTRAQGYLLALVRRSKFPWLAANLTVGDTDVPVDGIHPFIVRRLVGVRVGFLGLTSARAAAYPSTKGWTISDPIQAAGRWVPIARRECDILIAVTHITFLLDMELARRVPGIDAIVGGDSHTFLWSPLMVRNPDGHLVPIVQAGEQGVTLGKLDLRFDRAGGWHLVSARGKLIPVDDSVPEDPAVHRLVASYVGPYTVATPHKAVPRRVVRQAKRPAPLRRSRPPAKHHAPAAR